MSDGRFSAKPMRSERARDSTWAGEFTSDARLLTDASRRFVESPAILRELKHLMDQPFPPAGEVACAPLRKGVPEAALDLGKPLASAVLVQEFLISILFLRVCGWIFVAAGASMFLAAAIGVVLGAFRILDPVTARVLQALMGLGVAAAGVWFGILRGRVVNEMCWFCPRGMIWMTEGVFEWFSWTEIREVFCQLDADRPAIGIRFDQNLSMISFSDTHASRIMVEYIENRASAACAKVVLQLIADGRSAQFGVWRLSREALHGRKSDLDWRDLTELLVNDREIRIRSRHGDNLRIHLDDVPFPSLFTALATGIRAYVRETASGH